MCLKETLLESADWIYLVLNGPCFSESGSERSGYIKYRELFEYLSDCWLLSICSMWLFYLV